VAWLMRAVWETRVAASSAGVHTGRAENYASAVGAYREPVPRSRSDTSGNTNRGRRTFSVGASTVADPSITASPRWLTHRQSSTTRLRAGSFDATTTETAIVSPIAIGWRNRSVCSR